MKLSSLMALTAILGLAACNADPRTSSTPMTGASAGSSTSSPQSANGLPRGDVVNAPRAPATGNVSTTMTPGPVAPRTY